MFSNIFMLVMAVSIIVGGSFLFMIFNKKPSLNKEVLDHIGTELIRKQKGNIIYLVRDNPNILSDMIESNLTQMIADACIKTGKDIYCSDTRKATKEIMEWLRKKIS